MNKLSNNKLYLSEQIKKAYAKYFTIPIIDKMLDVHSIHSPHSNTKEADYKFVMNNLLRHLQNNGVNITIVELGEKLCEDIQRQFYNRI